MKTTPPSGPPLNDEKANNTRSEARISIPGAKVDVWVIPTNEEILIARDTVELSGLK